MNDKNRQAYAIFRQVFVHCYFPLEYFRTRDGKKTHKGNGRMSLL